jgi:quinol monooxygenase YgiN
MHLCAGQLRITGVIDGRNAVHVILRLSAQADMVEALKPVLLELAAQSRKEKDCVSYRVLQNQSDPCEFTLVEEWTNEPALDAHLQTQHVADAFARGGPLLAAAPDARRYRTLG